MLKVTIERLYKLGAEAKKYSTELVRKQALVELQAKAQSAGYSYHHWLSTGIWIKEESFETVSIGSLKPFQDTEQTVLETVKMPDKPFIGTVQTVSEGCEYCGKPFSSKRAKRFCSVQCKNSYHNQKRAISQQEPPSKSRAGNEALFGMESQE